MTSFIELPRLSYQGRPKASLYVNVADIVCLGNTDYVGQVNVTVRQLGTDGVGIVQTYVPLPRLLDALGILAEHPGVRSWVDSVLQVWAAPVAALLAESYQRERANWTQGSA